MAFPWISVRPPPHPNFHAFSVRVRGLLVIRWFLLTDYDTDYVTFTFPVSLVREAVFCTGLHALLPVRLRFSEWVLVWDFIEICNQR